ncbi:hypothetical protein [Paraburkholderia silvatlantica]|uniref:Transposase n=1 Tax=Paraburkholderia silvatlantica TaxID=321895 RepID=A0ABR6FRS6_9BURK|nr:hypothetical protein [Paraburkholderia silvatlantica]MBB2930139.1 hypothetical protein [Paraburkholderia silvatlantica]PVY22480.1 hypothetical protein C7411_13180 [Paraburkholderia silvatlantica]PXW28949.1 hypothetical protein C7413_13180 [Paraburkholderia silvatlantica]
MASSNPNHDGVRCLVKSTWRTRRVLPDAPRQHEHAARRRFDFWRLVASVETHTTAIGVELIDPGQWIDVDTFWLERPTLQYRRACGTRMWPYRPATHRTTRWRLQERSDIARSMRETVSKAVESGVLEALGDDGRPYARLREPLGRYFIERTKWEWFARLTWGEWIGTRRVTADAARPPAGEWTDARLATMADAHAALLAGNVRNATQQLAKQHGVSDRQIRKLLKRARESPRVLLLRKRK